MATTLLPLPAAACSSSVAAERKDAPSSTSARPTSPTEALLRRVAQRDEAALQDLYRREQRSVYGFALQLLRCEEDAEDVVVETFLEVWRHAHRFAGQSKATTWILGIARHKALDRLRVRQHVLLPEEEWRVVEETVAADNEPLFESLTRQRDAEALRRCLSRLPAEQRECIQLVFFNEMGLADVAAVQGVPENTVKTRLFHARRKMREWLAGIEREPDFVQA
jgi:RNA polymerase sigma-70 factor, ECF subfamily